MSRSAGTGSPVWFRCWRDRQRDYHDRDARVMLTGRMKPYRARRGHALGARSTFRLFEYECSCGYIGWSNHVDLLELAIAQGIVNEQERMKLRRGIE